MTAAARDGTLTRNPRLATHLQVCSHCLSRVFGDVREARFEDPRGRVASGRPPDE